MPDPTHALRAWLKWALFFALVMAVGLIDRALDTATGAEYRRESLARARRERLAREARHNPATCVFCIMDRQRIASGPPMGAPGPCRARIDTLRRGRP